MNIIPLINKKKVEYFTKSNKVTCKNRSIDNKQRYKNPTNTNKMTEIQGDISSYNPAELYKNYKAPVIFENKYNIKASNYIDFDNNIKPKNLGVKLLPSDNINLYPEHSKIDEIPFAYNYSF